MVAMTRKVPPRRAMKNMGSRSQPFQSRNVSIIAMLIILAGG